VGEVSGRGCASKEKLYYVQCENHEMEGLVEKFCYCSFNLCNAATKQVHHFYPPRRFYKRRADVVFAIHIYSRCTAMELFQLQVAPLVLKFGIHQEQAGRKGVSRREEEGKSGRVESQYS
jgi:hypothetical protein